MCVSRHAGLFLYNESARAARLAEVNIVLDPKLLEILACPLCKGELTPLPDHSALDCPACRLRYRVDDGIPIMLPEEAEALPPKKES